MSLVSLNFFLFAGVSVAGYYLIPGKARPYWLLLFSLVFYLCAGPVYILFLLFCASVTFIGALYTGKTGQGKYSIIAVILVLAVLIGLKFIPYSLRILNSRFGFSRIPAPTDWLLPLGISFFTLSAVDYCATVRKGETAHETNFFHYLLFLSYFPVITQGPISRSKQLLPQLTESHKFSFETVRSGFVLMIWGIFKKLMIADRAALFVNTIFINTESFQGGIYLIASLVYMIQLYADFSGCVDICRGVSRMYGIELASNFDHPYFSGSIKEFWRRWHLSLSFWLRDHVYFPLGGSRKGSFRKYVNLTVVFLISGMWHGTGLRYLLWGLIYAVYQIVGDLTANNRTKINNRLFRNPNALPLRILRSVITFALLCIPRILFRAESVGHALRIYRAIATDLVFPDLPYLYTLGMEGNDWTVFLVSALLLLLVSHLELKAPVEQLICDRPFVLRCLILLILLFAVIVFGIYGPGYAASQFIYMQF